VISTKRSADDIKVVHGIRWFNAWLLMISHKSMAVMYVPFVNKTDAVREMANPYSVATRLAAVYTEPFLMLSGLLTAYSWLGKLKKRKQINLFEEIIGRYIRYEENRIIYFFGN
jgi:hypothetical protein